MLAYNGLYDLEKDIRYPVYVSVKYDGIRLYKWGGKWYTRSKKESVNPNIIRELDKLTYIPDGFDCELCYGKSFHEGQELIRSQSLPIDQLAEPILLLVHDWMNSALCAQARIHGIKNWFYLNNIRHDKFLVFNVEQKLCANAESVRMILGDFNNSIEGLILRGPNSTYKFNGRSTLAEQALIKYIPTVEETATVLHFNEMMTHLRRKSKRIADMRGTNLLGSFVVTNERWGSFCLSGQMDHKFRSEVWNNQDKYKGKTVKFKYKPYGSKDKPRCPIFTGFVD